MVTPRTAAVTGRGAARPRKRAAQQRSIATRAAILRSALTLFAENGFEGVSMRDIAERSGLQAPLITYHFRTKQLLWQAAAETAFEHIRHEWDRLAAAGESVAPLEQLRREYRALFRYTVAFPEFHRFMRQETLSRNPRLVWVMEAVLKPLLDRLIPQIQAAQAAGSLPPVDPIVFHYMMVSLSATLSEFGPEMELTDGVDPSNATVISQYWSLVERLVFPPNGTR